MLDVELKEEEEGGNLTVTAKPPAADPDTIIESIVAGGTQLFEARYDGTGDPLTGITWTVAPLAKVDGKWTTAGAIPKQTDTTVDTWGVLKVSLDEQTAGLRVTASVNGKSGSYDLARLPSNQAMTSLLAELSDYVSSASPEIIVTDTGVDIPYTTTIKVAKGQILTIPKGVTLTFKNEGGIATTLTTENVINGDVIVRGALIIEDGTTSADTHFAKATGTGNITVENGGIYTEATSADATTVTNTSVFRFFTTGKKIVKYGGTLKANKYLWDGSGSPALTPALEQVPAFIGANADSVIRPSVGGEVVINKLNLDTTNRRMDYEVTGPVVINEGKAWTLDANDTLKIGVYDKPNDILTSGFLTVQKRAGLETTAVTTANTTPTITLYKDSEIITQGSGGVKVGDHLVIGEGNGTFRAKVEHKEYPIEIVVPNGGTTATITINSGIAATDKTEKGYGLFLLGTGSDTAKVISLQAQAQTVSTAVTKFTFAASTTATGKPVVLAAGTEAITIPGGSSSANGAKLTVDAKGSIDFGTGGNGILLGYIDSTVAHNGTLSFTTGAILGVFDEKASAKKTLPTASFANGTFTANNSGVLSGGAPSVTPKAEDQILSAAINLE